MILRHLTQRQQGPVQTDRDMRLLDDPGVVNVGVLLVLFVLRFFGLFYKVSAIQRPSGMMQKRERYFVEEQLDGVQEALDRDRRVRLIHHRPRFQVDQPRFLLFFGLHSFFFFV